MDITQDHCINFRQAAKELRAGSQMATKAIWKMTAWDPGCWQRMALRLHDMRNAAGHLAQAHLAEAKGRPSQGSSVPSWVDLETASVRRCWLRWRMDAKNDDGAAGPNPH